MRALCLLCFLCACDARDLWGDALVVPDPRNCTLTGSCPDGQVCNPATLVCEPQSGAPCTQDAECKESGVCLSGERLQRMAVLDPTCAMGSAGRCATPMEAAIVDDTKCDMDTNNQDGSPERPYCALQPALTAGRRWVLLRGGTQQSVSVSRGCAAIIGPGHESRDQTPDLAGLRADGGAKVLLADLMIGGMNSKITCGKEAGLTLWRSRVLSAQIEAPECRRIEIDSVWVEGAAGSMGPGIAVSKGTFRIVNTLVKNWSPAVALNVGGTFSFNTVLGEVVCLGPGVRISDSIVESVGRCETLRIVSPREVRLDASARLIMPGSERAVDQAGTDSAVKTDYFGASRPKRSGYDIGFHELE